MNYRQTNVLIGKWTDKVDRGRQELMEKIDVVDGMKAVEEEK